MSMDQLFKALPEALQWEIMTEFVGTHLVRYNKLRRKMTGEIHSLLLQNYKSRYPIIDFAYLNFYQSKYDLVYFLCRGWGLKREWFRTQPTVVLPPYVKHHFPSYPYTNKKLGKTPQPVTFFKPIYRNNRRFVHQK